jgi:hypothetical protein
MYSFGSGVLLGTRTDIPNATPVNFGLVQEVTIDETATIKELTGQFQRPVAIARGSIKTTGNAFPGGPLPTSSMVSRNSLGRSPLPSLKGRHQSQRLRLPSQLPTPRPSTTMGA